MDGTVLVADDDRTIRTVLTQALTRAGCKVHATASLVTLMRWVDEGKGDLVISDVVMPDGNGIEQLPQIAERRPGLPVIVISAQNTIMTAIQAAEAEAYDYLPKPFDLPDLMSRAARALEIKRHTPATRTDLAEMHTDLPLVGHSPAMQALYRLVARVMNTELPVLITGESGTGKSLIARALHDFSDRRNRPFVSLAPADINGLDDLSKAFDRARGRTILFDEVGDLSDAQQGMIIRLLDANNDNPPRILATTRKDLLPSLEKGRFREDFYYRINGVGLNVPPLRDRLEDIPALIEHFLRKAERDGMPERQISGAALEVAHGYAWPGNIRQLENIVRRLTVTALGSEISGTEMEGALVSQPEAEPLKRGMDTDKLSVAVERHLRRYFDLHGGMLPPPGLYQKILREVEIPLIEIALDATAGNQAKCADLLGINRNTLRKKITELDIRVTRRRKLM